MAKTKTAIVAREIMDTTKRGSIMFNDKLANGARSLKVWGWSDAEYRLAKRKLEAMGCQVAMVLAPPYYDYRGMQARQSTRLHVVE